MGKKLVLAGGGHAHMVCLEMLHRFVAKGHAVTVIGPSDHHYYSGMGPGMLGQTYTPEQVRFDTRHVVEKQGGTFLRGQVVRIDPEKQTVHLKSGEAVSYDLLSCNLGSHVPEEIVDGDLHDVYLVKPIERLLEAKRRILELGTQSSITVGIIGGGPSAIEIAGNVWRLGRQPGMQPLGIRILAGSTIMPNHPSGVRSRATASLTGRGIEIKENCTVARIETGRATDRSGRTHLLDIIFVATGVRPNSIFEISGIPVGPDGGMRVNRYLQCSAYETIFGGGDCIYFEPSPLDKVGVYAVRQNPILYRNLMASLEGEDLQAFHPGGEYLLIFNLGDGTGIFHKWFLQFGGRLAFIIKNYLDLKFMRRFQRIE